MQVGVNCGELADQAAAHRSQDADDDQRDQSGDQAIFQSGHGATIGLQSNLASYIL